MLFPFDSHTSVCTDCSAVFHRWVSLGTESLRAGEEQEGGGGRIQGLARARAGEDEMGCAHLEPGTALPQKLACLLVQVMDLLLHPLLQPGPCAWVSPAGRGWGAELQILAHTHRVGAGA